MRRQRNIEMKAVKAGHIGFQMVPPRHVSRQRSHPGLPWLTGLLTLAVRKRPRPPSEETLTWLPRCRTLRQSLRQSLRDRWTVGTRVQGTKNLSFNKVSRGATLPKTCASSESNENSYEFMRIARTPFNSRF